MFRFILRLKTHVCRFVPGTSLAFIGLLFLQLAGSARAQDSQVTIYGILDTGVEVVTNVGPKKEDVVHETYITGTRPSRLGFKSTEDLGGGLTAIAVLEAVFGVNQGTLNQGGRLFGRQAWVGISGDWGTVGLGRQYSQIYLSTIGDTMGPSVHSMGLLDSYLPNARLDNAISYRGTFENITVGTTVSLGRDAVDSPAAGGCPPSSTDNKACRAYSGVLQYATSKWAIAGTFERDYGGTGPNTPLPLSSQTDTRNILSGWVQLSTTKLGAGIIHRDNEGSVTPISNIVFAGTETMLGKWQIDLQVSKLKYADSANAAAVFAARSMYWFSKQTAGYFSLGRLDNQGKSALTIDGGVTSGSSPLPGVGQSGAMFGIRIGF